MPASTSRSIAVFQIHPAILLLAALLAQVVQTFLPLKLPVAGLMDFPLLIVIYFSMLRRDKVFGIGMGTCLGLLQDSLSHGYIGVFGIAKAIVGYMAASASTRFELESMVTRAVLTALFVLAHSLCVAGIEHALLQSPPPFSPLPWPAQSW